MRPFVSLCGKREFALAMRKGAVASTPAATVYAFSPPARVMPPPRVGVIVTRKVGNAVVRNRIRRRCKAVMERLLSATDRRWYVVACKPASGALPFSDLARQLAGAMPKAAGPRMSRA
jgi:ribonuclease P protein component